MLNQVSNSSGLQFLASVYSTPISQPNSNFAYSSSASNAPSTSTSTSSYNPFALSSSTSTSAYSTIQRPQSIFQKPGFVRSSPSIPTWGSFAFPLPSPLGFGRSVHQQPLNLASRANEPSFTTSSFQVNQKPLSVEAWLALTGLPSTSSQSLLNDVY